jgi:hypothetical protein
MLPRQKVPIFNLPFPHRFAMIAAVPEPHGDRSRMADSAELPLLITTVFRPDKPAEPSDIL